MFTTELGGALDNRYKVLGWDDYAVLRDLMVGAERLLESGRHIEGFEVLKTVPPTLERVLQQAKESGKFDVSPFFGHSPRGGPWYGRDGFYNFVDYHAHASRSRRCHGIAGDMNLEAVDFVQPEFRGWMSRETDQVDYLQAVARYYTLARVAEKAIPVVSRLRHMYECAQVRFEDERQQHLTSEGQRELKANCHGLDGEKAGMHWWVPRQVDNYLTVIRRRIEEMQQWYTDLREGKMEVPFLTIFAFG